MCTSTSVQWSRPLPRLRSLVSRQAAELLMSKPNLQLIHCSNVVPLRADHLQKSRSFRPLVIDGGVRRGEPGWDATLKLFDGLLVFHQNYFAFLAAHMAFLWGLHRERPERPGRSA